MEIQDIIKTDDDRLFIVDPECYIIFTGTSMDDDKPFIRIGNWMNMPIELIPLIENIVITDTIIGNPSGEQFNIDIRTLSSNRYIGSRDIVTRYLEFQRIFGLDLGNANVVNAETDIPVLSQERNISERNQFIGVFYRDGNFKTVHNSSTIIDMKEIARLYKNSNDFHDEVSFSAAKSTRFSGRGLVIAGHNPIFFSKGSFTSYLFPFRYLDLFSRLGIDPNKISDIIHPSMTLLNISRFLKWKNDKERGVTILCDHRDLIKKAKRLFPHAKIRQIDFQGMNHQAEGDLRFSQYAGSYNIRIKLKTVPPENREITVAYLKASGGLKEILKDGPDALFISYSVYEDAALLIRSSKIPFVIIDDGNKNIKKLTGTESIILRSGAHYEIESHDDIKSIASKLLLPAEFIPQDKDYDSWLSKIMSVVYAVDTDDNNDLMKCNIATMLSIVVHTTKVRELAAKCKDILLKLKIEQEMNKLLQHGELYIFRLMFHKNGIFLGVTAAEAGSGMIIFDDVILEEREIYAGTRFGSYFDRILTDRDRLYKLLALFTGSEKFHTEYDDKVRLLRKEIEKRKNLSTSTHIVEEDAYRKVMMKGRDLSIFTADEPPAVEAPSSHEKRNITNKKIGVIAAVALVIIAVTLFVLYRTGLFGPGREIDQHDKRLTAAERTFYEKKYNIVISDREIFTYSNKVSALNGYNPIPYQTMNRGKNPDWIYPRNTFRMTDGEVVTVKEGDTLWHLSRDKLVRMTVLFNEAVEKSKSLAGPGRVLALEKAKKYAFTDAQANMIDLLVKQTAAENEKGRK